MNVAEKFNQIICRIEENLANHTKDSRSLYDEISSQLGIGVRTIGECFSFITNMTLAEYIRQRKLTAAFNDKVNNQLKWIDVACKFGYSDESSFQRAFKNAFGMTASEMENTKSYEKLMQPLSLNISVEGDRLEFANCNIENKDDYLQYLTKTFREKRNTLCLQQDGVLREKNIEVQKVNNYLNLLGEESCLGNFNLAEALSLIKEFETCQAIYGLKFGEVLLVYELLRKKNTLYDACEEFAFMMNATERSFDNLRKTDLIDIYLLINAGLVEFDVRDFLKSFSFGYNELKTLEIEDIIVLASCTSGYTIHIKKPSYNAESFSWYMKFKKWAQNHAKMNFFKTRKRYSPLESVSCLDIPVDEYWISATCRLFVNLGDDKFTGLTNKDKIAESEINALFLTSYYDLNFDDAFSIAKNILPSFKNIDEFEPKYVDFIYIARLFLEENLGELSFEHYTRFLDITEKVKLKGYDDKNHNIALNILHFGYSEEEAFEAYDDYLRRMALAEKYQIQLKKIEFAEAISNSYVDKEKAYQVMCKVYKNKSMWESGKDRFSEQEVLALILHLNTGDDITLCETAANELFKSIRLDRKGIINFVFVNMCASAQRITKEFSLVSIEDYLKVKNLVSGGIADHSNVIAHIIVTAKARNESIEVIYQEVKAELEE